MSVIPSLEANKALIGLYDTSVTSAAASLGLSSGVLVNAGLNYFGATIPTGLDLAGVNIGPPLAVTGAFLSLNVEGGCNFVGIHNVAGIHNMEALSNIFGFTNKVGAEIQAAFKSIFGLKTNAAVQITQGPKVCQATASAPVFTGVFVGNGDGLTFAKKPFDIPHPTKKGWRLRHVCIEGPTADVYVRGKLENSNIIELPEYWRKLVDPETITVNLTPIGVYQELFVEKIEWGTRVIVKNNSGSAINCYYTVYGERADTDKNIPEYEGTYDDYPGDNRQYTYHGTSAITQ